MDGNHAFDEHGGNVYQAIRNRNSDGIFLDFSANINPLGLPNCIREEILHSLDSIIHYPDAEGHDLKAVLAEFYRVNTNIITLGNGAVELLYILCHIIKPRRALVTAPAFSEYERAARAGGAAIHYYQLSEKQGFSIDVEGLSGEIQCDDIIFLGNPNNPTGTILSNSDLEFLIKIAYDRKAFVVVDESFIDFLPDDTEYSCRHMVDSYPNLFILHSLTKFYAIPGLRLGFSLANGNITRQLHMAKDPWNVNTLAQKAGVVALRDIEYREKTRKVVHDYKNKFFLQLQAIQGCKAYTPAVNFILVNIAGMGMSSAQLREYMFNNDILIRDCGNYPGLSSQYIRVAVKLPELNDRLVATLKKAGDNFR